MRKFAMRAFPATWDFVESGFPEIVDKLSDFSWYFYRFNVERKLLNDERNTVQWPAGHRAAYRIHRACHVRPVL